MEVSGRWCRRILVLVVAATTGCSARSIGRHYDDCWSSLTSCTITMKGIERVADDDIKRTRYRELCRRQRWVEACIRHEEMTRATDPADGAISLLHGCLHWSAVDKGRSIDGLLAERRACESLDVLWDIGRLPRPTAALREHVAERRAELATAIVAYDRKVNQNRADFWSNFNLLLGGAQAGLSTVSANMPSSVPAHTRSSSSGTTTASPSSRSPRPPAATPTHASSSASTDDSSTAWDPEPVASSSSSTAWDPEPVAPPSRPASSPPSTTWDPEPVAPPSPRPPKAKPKPEEPEEPEGREALAYCWPNRDRTRWTCHGPVQLLQLSHPLDEALELAGCTDVRRYVPFRDGRLYACTFRLKPYDIDIRPKYGASDL